MAIKTRHPKMLEREMINTQNYVRFLKVEAKRNLIMAAYYRTLGNEDRWIRHMGYARNSIRMAAVLS